MLWYRPVVGTGDVIAGGGLGGGVTEAGILVTEGGDQEKKAGRLRNRHWVLTADSTEYGVSDERASGEDGAVPRR